ncbi:MAG: hypothetical protein LBE82_04765 [Chitinophagaceae bacterium]|jgi:hypothetical protein|nr:hypothetical protein [Chitinophagaceae bacterium]
MTNEEKRAEIVEMKEKDFLYDRVSSSRFLFYVNAFWIIALIVAGSFQLYLNHYKGKPDIEIQGSSKYEPQYK